MLNQGARPRELRWFHSGPMLFGDWGTSRLYVLGLAFYYTGRASIWFMLAMSVVLIAVGWAYSVICRLFPDGGGVYSSARHRSQTLAVIGALLLCADYVVTASLSALDAFHYLRLPHAEIWAAGSILLIGLMNYFGPTKVGTFALFVALFTVVMTLAVGGAAVPSLSHAQFDSPAGTPVDWWTQFTRLILAISGVEAVANMTGIMVKPVERTARWSIWPVLLEIVVMNLILTLAMQALPLDVLGNGDPALAQTAHRDDMLRVLAEHYIGHAFAAVASLVFSLLLLSAVNTAVTDLVSIQFMMSRDRELPPLFGGLNAWGMPVIPLVIGAVVPTVTVLAFPDVGHLADLYAIGVVGAVVVNLGSCCTNPAIDLRRAERVLMMGLTVLLVLVWITIAWEKPHALLFASTIVGVGLVGRWGAHNRSRMKAWMLEPVPTMFGIPAGALGASRPAPLIAAETVTNGAAAGAAAVVAAAPQVPRERILVSTRGNPQLIQFALDEAESRRAELLVLFVRHIAVPTMGPSHRGDASEDPEAQEVFSQFQQSARDRGIPVRFLYAVAWDIAEAILDIAASHGVDTLLLGATKRGHLWRTMKGDVIQQVSEYLPERIRLLILA